MSNLKKQIGSNIRTERVSRGISMEELAEMLEISPAFVGLIERGQRGASVKNLLKISKIFNVSIDSLLGSEKSKYLTVAEEKKSLGADAKRETIKSLSFDLSENELDFVIASIRSLRQLRVSSLANDPSEFDDDDSDDDDIIKF